MEYTESSITSTLNIISWNARSLTCFENKSKLYELYNYLDSFETSPEIICIQETWNHLGQNLLNLKGYKPPVSFRRQKGKQGGGVAIFVKIGIDSEEIKFTHENENIEISMVKVFALKQTLEIANFYTPGGTFIPAADYSKIAKKLGKNALIVGDFNARHELWETGFNTADKNALEIIHFLNTTDYLTLNTGCGTRLDPVTGNLSTLDLTLATVSVGHKCDWHVHDDTLGSDHFPIVTSVSVRHKHVKQERMPRWNLDKADWGLFKQITHEMHIKFDDYTINEANDQFLFELTTASELAIPLTKPLNKKKKVVPWWEERCTLAVKKRRIAYTQFKKHRKSADAQAYFDKFKLARSEAKFTINTVRKEKWREFISTLSYKTNSKKIWDTLKKFNGKPYNPIEVLKINNLRFHENKDKAEILTKHYQKVSSDGALSQAFMQHKTIQEPIINNLIWRKASSGEHRAYNANFTIKELKTALSKKKSTAPGGDTIHYDMLKNLDDKGKFQLLGLINKSWNEGELPTEWKESTIIPLLKPKKDPHDPQSYRPVSLTSTICKTMETMISSRLTAHIEHNNLLANVQSG